MNKNLPETLGMPQKPSDLAHCHQKVGFWEVEVDQFKWAPFQSLEQQEPQERTRRYIRTYVSKSRHVCMYGMYLWPSAYVSNVRMYVCMYR